MPGHDIIVIGASAGGVEALMTVVRNLPADLPAAVFAVLHIPAQAPSLLDKILNRVGKLHTIQPNDHSPIQPGHIYVARPDHHLLIERGYVRVIRGPKENRHRPAIDPLFRSAAQVYGPRVIGVVLTGSLDDGTAGLYAIKQRGGLAVVQDPEDALYPSMPQSAITHVQVNYVLPLADIGATLAQLAHEPATQEGVYPVPDEMELETRIMEMDGATMQGTTRPGNPSIFSCPECKGVLYEIQDGDLMRFRCRTGHAFSAESVLVEQSEAIEDALYAALNTLEESVLLAQRMKRQADERGQEWLAQRFREKIEEAQARADIIRRVLLKDETIAVVEAVDGHPAYGELAERDVDNSQTEPSPHE